MPATSSWKRVAKYGALALGVAAVVMIGSGACKKDSSRTAGKESREAYEKSKELVKDYIAMTKDKDVDPGAFNGHTGMMAMLNAIKAAKSLEPAVVKVALERVEFEAANGPFRFRREDHQGIVNVSVISATALMSPKRVISAWLALDGDRMSDRP